MEDVSYIEEKSVQNAVQWSSKGIEQIHVEVRTLDLFHVLRSLKNSVPEGFLETGVQE